MRQQVLEGVGWTLHRVWSTDWYSHNQAETGQGLLEAVERAKFALAEEAPAVHLSEPDPVSPEPEPPPLPEPSSSIADYVACADLGILIHGELHAQPPSQLAKAILQIVEVESPVHIDEVVLRIRNLWGLGRAGARIKDAVERAVFSAQRDGRIQRKGKFLWTTDTQEVKVRQRKSPKIEWICDEEIAEAMKRVITTQGAILRDALITESVKAFGYKASGETVFKRLRLLLGKLAEVGEFQILPNGTVRLP